MKIIKITEERLKDIIDAFYTSNDLPVEYKTYQIHEKPNIYLQIISSSTLKKESSE